MKAEDIYTLGPEVVTEEMIELATSSLPDELGEDTDRILENSSGYLEVAQRYYRLGAFNMEHKDDPICEAEDQGGWPACKHPAEFYVLDRFLGDSKRRIYCSLHQDNRFYSPKHMAPIYESPGAAWCQHCGVRIERKYTCCKTCADERGP